ncbi:MAG: DUF485 domain-containing protein [Chitinophagaceae bacterium]|nr:DUF485 domain-containing protein [Chitinophagaceae bacterium]
MQNDVFHEQESELVLSKKARLGVKFFFIYLIVYGGFVAIGVLNYELLAAEVFRGINLAIFYGFGLILLAVLLGVWYNYLCSRYEKSGQKEEGRP